MALTCGPPCSPGKTAESTLAASALSVVRMHAPRGPYRVLWVVKEMTWAWPMGLGTTPAATMPAMCEMSASRYAPTASAIWRKRAQSGIHG